MEFVVERAKSSLSKCKGCSKAIAKDTPRVGIKMQSNVGGFAWYELDPKCLRKQRRSPGWWEEHFTPENIVINEECISTQELEDLIQKTIALEDGDADDDGGGETAAETPPQRGKRSSEAGSQSGKRNNAQTVPEYDGGVLSPEQVESIKQKMNEIKGKTNQYLQALLRANHQKISGKKEDLIVRVSELSVLGALPMCPDCSKACLHYNRADGVYTCPGSHEKGHMVKCGFRSDDVQRVPWEDVE